MLYANGTPANDYQGLFKVLSDVGVDDKTLEIANQYLNMEQSMDNSLLDAVAVQDFSGRLGYQERDAIRKAVGREIHRPQNEELLDRYTLLMHAIAGSSCTPFLVFPGGMTDEAHLLRALKKRFGADAYPAAAAISMECYVRTYRGTPPKGTDPTTGLNAIKYCTTALPRAKCMLCAYILCETPLPEKKLLFGTKVSPIAMKAVEMLEKIWTDAASFQKDSDGMKYLVLASAVGAYYSKELAKHFSRNVKSCYMEIANIAVRMPYANAAERILAAISSYIGNAAYIKEVAHWTFTNTKTLGNGKQLQLLAEKYPQMYRAVMDGENNPKVTLLMDEILRKADPSYRPSEDDLRRRCQNRCVEVICNDYPNQKAEITAYLQGETGIEPLLPLAPQMELPKYYFSRVQVNYIAGFGLDDFAKRCICVHAVAVHGLSHYANCTPGFKVHGNEAQFIEILREGSLPFPVIFKCAGELVENAPTYNGIQTEMRDKFCTEFSESIGEVAACDVKPLNVTGRSMYLEVLGKHPETYKLQILSLADDTSKVIRAELAAFLKKHPEWTEDVLTLLNAKKAAKRELAVDVLGAYENLDAYQDALQAAFEKEKKAELKQKLAALLGTECPEEAAAETLDALIADMTKGSKVKKLQWLFDTPFAPVRKTDGTQAETAHLQAILLCYANMAIPGVNPTAAELARELNTGDLAAFVLEVMGKWLEQGAIAKQKWVLYAVSLHGDFEAQTTIVHYIKDWSEHSRGALAAEAVRALAFKGTSEALMAVDNMARKFKSSQVRAAASSALEQAAGELGITTEELADRIVPNLGFDETLCREFDYGTRQFRVYLTPALELEIFEGQKKLKNLPKPGTKDEPEKAEAASKAFKEMKKQLKTVITTQKQRLEYVLMCHRTWTAQGWQDLFVKNPVMHCFAIGLIWGTYDENGSLLETFRYMEDGSFNTADEDEFTLPENAVIGLVHPVELDADTLSAWKEQLEDYEITQPFQQLERPVFTLAKDEIGQTDVIRFAERTLNNLSLMGRMLKFGWYKGAAGDGGWFYEFGRTDIVRREKDETGKLRNIGNYAELIFSGMYIAGYDSEDVTIEKLQFYDLESRDPVKLETVNPRYFSEVMIQVSAALAAAAPAEGE